MTDDELADYCRRVLQQVQDDNLTPPEILAFAGYLATCALNLAAPQHRTRARRGFENSIRHALAVTRANVDAVHHGEHRPPRFDA